MRKTILLVLTVLIGFVLPAEAQRKRKRKPASVTYKMVVNGKDMDEYGKIVLTYRKEVVSLERINPNADKIIDAVPKEITYIDYINQKIYQVSSLNNGDCFHTVDTFDQLPKPELTDEKEEILGYPCRKATVELFSNRIDLWYTTGAYIKGNPYIRAGNIDGLVLKVVRNGNFAIVADSIRYKRKRGDDVLLPENLGEEVPETTYDARKVENYVKTVKVFNNEQISWGNEIRNPEDENSSETFRYAGGTIILRKVKLPEVTDDYTIFTEITQYSNGDAYDRTGTIFMIPAGKKYSFLDGLREGAKAMPVYLDKDSTAYQGVVATEEFEPAVELTRFFTPFGVGHFNKRREVEGVVWEDSATYKQDITYLMPLLKNEMWIGAFIGNYDKGGHKLSLKLKYHPGSMEVNESKTKQWIMPLFNTLNIMEMAGQTYATMFNDDSLKVAFNIPEGVKNVRMQYISTGHGGWGGGDEFNQKLNEVFVDGKKVFSYIPWRSDCGTYRKYNPASGNFWNGVSSSDLSRSGWCPGAVTNPVTIPLFDLNAGKHVMQIAIPLGAKEGNSFSSWNVSGVLIGDYE